MAVDDTSRSAPGGPLRVDLPAAPVKRERADAVRNRELVLAAAADLFERRDPREVTMDEVARAAGVGRATLYRRYPDVRSIAVALLDGHERELQRRMIAGAPPLGPGAPPDRRLAAFFAAMTDLLERFQFLLLAAETGPARFRTGAYGFWRAHVRAQLVDAGVDDAGARADLLLATVEPELYRHLRTTLSPEQISAHLGWLAVRVVHEPACTQGTEIGDGGRSMSWRERADRS